MVLGFVLINAVPSRMVELCSKVKRLPEVQEVYPVFGEYNMFAKIEADDFEKLGQIILKRIRSIGGIIDTRTFIARMSPVWDGQKSSIELEVPPYGYEPNENSTSENIMSHTSDVPTLSGRLRTIKRRNLPVFFSSIVSPMKRMLRKYKENQGRRTIGKQKRGGCVE